jgi:hypothetical protein
MPDNSQKQHQEKVEELIMFVATIAGLVFMVLYWR